MYLRKKSLMNVFCLASFMFFKVKTSEKKKKKSASAVRHNTLIFNMRKQV